jgi:hypothetical protein
MTSLGKLRRVRNLLLKAALVIVVPILAAFSCRLSRQSTT